MREDAKARGTYQEQNLPLNPFPTHIINPIQTRKKGNHGFTISVATGSALNLKDFNIKPDHYAVQMTATSTWTEGTRICYAIYFPREELGVSREQKSLWVRKKTIARDAKDPRQKVVQERRMTHDDFLDAGKFTIEITKDGEKICTDHKNFKDLNAMQPSFVLLPIPMV